MYEDYVPEDTSKDDVEDEGNKDTSTEEEEDKNTSTEDDDNNDTSTEDDDNNNTSTEDDGNKVYEFLIGKTDADGNVIDWPYFESSNEYVSPQEAKTWAEGQVEDFIEDELDDDDEEN